MMYLESVLQEEQALCMMMRYAERLGILIGNWTWIKIVFLRNVGHLVSNRQTSLAYCALQMTSSSHWFVRRRHLIHR